MALKLLLVLSTATLATANNELDHDVCKRQTKTEVEFNQCLKTIKVLRLRGLIKTPDIKQGKSYYEET